MKRVNIFTLCLCLSVSAFALAQIPGAIGFKSDEKPSDFVEVTENTANQHVVSDEVDARDLLAKKIKKQRIWDNPRFSKKVYGSLKGMQNSIEKEQNKELEKKKLTSEEEKAKALEKMKTQAIVHFEDFTEEPEIIHQKMNEQPRERILDMTERLDYIEKDKLTSGFSDYIQDEMEQQFVKRNAVTMEEYQEASRQQMQEAHDMRLAEGNKADTFPPLTVDNPVNVEKIDEQNALLRIGVGAPVSKKK